MLWSGPEDKVDYQQELHPENEEQDNLKSKQKTKPTEKSKRGDLGFFVFYAKFGDSEEHRVSWMYDSALYLSEEEDPRTGQLLTFDQGEGIAATYVTESEQYFLEACIERQIDPEKEKGNFKMRYEFVPPGSKPKGPKIDPYTSSGVPKFHIDQYLDRKYMAPFEEHVSCSTLKCGHEIAYRRKNESQLRKILGARSKYGFGIGDRVKCPVCKKWTSVKSGRGGGYWTEGYRALDKLVGDKIWAEVPGELLEGSLSFENVKKKSTQKKTETLKQGEQDEQSRLAKMAREATQFGFYNVKDGKKICRFCKSTRIVGTGVMEQLQTMSVAEEIFYCKNCKWFLTDFDAPDSSENMIDTHSGNSVAKLVGKITASDKKKALASYHEHSAEFKKTFGAMVKKEDKAYELFQLMLKDLLATGEYTTGQAIDKIAEDHKGLQRFSRATMYRHLPAEMKRTYTKRPALPQTVTEDKKPEVSEAPKTLLENEEAIGPIFDEMSGVPINEVTQIAREVISETLDPQQSENRIETIEDVMKVRTVIQDHPEILAIRYKVPLVCGHDEIALLVENDSLEKLNRMHCEKCQAHRDRHPSKVTIKEIVIDQGQEEVKHLNDLLADTMASIDRNAAATARLKEELTAKLDKAKFEERRMRDLSIRASQARQKLEKEVRDLKMSFHTPDWRRL